MMAPAKLRSSWQSAIPIIASGLVAGGASWGASDRLHGWRIAQLETHRDHDREEIAGRLRELVDRIDKSDERAAIIMSEQNAIRIQILRELAVLGERMKGIETKLEQRP